MAYIFLLVIAALFIIYYFYVVPANKNDLHDRGNRILKTLTSSFQKQVQVLENTFSEIRFDKKDDLGQFRNHQDAYRKLYENTQYEVVEGNNDTPGIRMVNDAKGWYIRYDVPAIRSAINVPLQRFGDKLFDHRRDLFDSYVLLLPPEDKGPFWKLIYKSSNLTNSDEIRIDSSHRKHNNSDNSAIVFINIGGVDQVLFLQSFSLHGKEVLVGGVLPKYMYREQLYNIPPGFVVPIVIIVLLMLIVLPLLKVYFLSRNETVHYGDILGCNVSIFMGSSAVLMILIFLYLFTLTSASYRNRMHDLGKQIRTELAQQLDSAELQLDIYDSIYRTLSPNERKKLADLDTNSRLDNLLCPDRFPHLKRLLWIDSAGNTVAKWTPLKYTYPLTSVAQYDFFQEVKAMQALSEPARKMAVGSGWSNVTGEFLVFMAKAMKKESTEKSKGPVAVALATSLYLNTYPVIPPGFGYCIVNRKGDILLHSDNKRKLSENIFIETQYIPSLYNSVRLKTDGLVKDVQLYGRTHDMAVYHLDEYPVSVILYFQKDRVIGNISRFLHFSITCLLFLFLYMALYMALFTYERRGPLKIRFHLHKREWMRPSTGNQYSYFFTIRYFALMLLINIPLFIAFQYFNQHMRILLFLSLLLPLYTLMGIVISRKSLTRSHGQSNFWKSNRFTKVALASLLMLVILNSIFIRSFIDDPASSFYASLFLLIGVQLLYFISMAICYFDVVKEWKAGVDVIPPDREGACAVEYYYRKSIYGALLLISVLPTFGITSYGYFAEKIQHKKEKELAIALDFEVKYNYLSNKAESPYKANLAADDSLQRPLSHLQAKGIYLSDNDTILLTKPDSYPELATGYDGPYLWVSKELSHHTGSLLGKNTLAGMSADAGRSWKFAAYNDSLVLQYKTAHPGQPHFWVSSRYQTPWPNFLGVFFPGGLVFLTIVFLFLWGCFAVIRATVQRLFLLHFSRPVKVDEGYLKKFFETASPGNTLSSADYLQTLIHLEEEVMMNESYEDSEEFILEWSHRMSAVYEKIWDGQLLKERFLLYDLAKDGYTNYKNPEIIYSLMHKGILKYGNCRLDFFSHSFRNFVIIKGDEPNLQNNFKEYSIGGVWQSLRAPVLLVIIALIVFFIMTQQKVAQDLTTVISSLLALIPLLTQLLGRGSPANIPDSK